jgi:hypothetical protein
MKQFVFVMCLTAGGIPLALVSRAEGESRTCRILFIAPAAGAPEKVFLTDGASSQEVELPTGNLSPVYKLGTGNITLRLFSKLPADPKDLPAGAPSAAVSETVTDCYLLIASDPSNKVSPLKMQVVDTGGAVFGAGDLMWFNTSKFEVGGRLGSADFRVKPNSRTVVNPGVSGYDSFPVKIGYSPGAGKPAAPLCTTVWQSDPSARTLVFVHGRPTATFPQIRGFIDSRAAEDDGG